MNAKTKPDASGSAGHREAMISDFKLNKNTRLVVALRGRDGCQTPSKFIRNEIRDTRRASTRRHPTDPDPEPFESNKPKPVRRRPTPPTRDTSVIREQPRAGHRILYQPSYRQLAYCRSCNALIAQQEAHLPAVIAGFFCAQCCPACGRKKENQS